MFSVLVVIVSSFLGIEVTDIAVDNIVVGKDEEGKVVVVVGNLFEANIKGNHHKVFRKRL